MTSLLYVCFRNIKTVVRLSANGYVWIFKYCCQLIFMELNEEKMIKIISQKTGMSKEEINELIEKKMEEFGGLISKTGILLIIGKELGIDLIKPKEKNLKVENLVDGLRKVNILLKVVKIINKTEFKRKNGEKGKVLSFLGADETGVVKVSIWNDKVDEFEKENIKEGDVVEIKNAYTRVDEFGKIELRIGTFGFVKKSDESVNVCEDIIEGIELKKTEYINVKINEVKENMYVEIRGVITSIFEKQLIHYFCPICKEKVDEKKQKCEVHGNITPVKLLIINGYIDDGYGRIRYVLFKNTAEKLINTSTEKLYNELKIKGEKQVLEEIKSKCLGKYMIFKGVVKRNDIINANELVVNNIALLKIEKEEIKKNLEKIKLMVS